MDVDEGTSSKAFEAGNTVETDTDELYRFDNKDHLRQLNEKPWANNPNYFTKVKISSLALLKMVKHAKSGGTLEIMGLMIGKYVGDTVVVLDSFALPGEGTETRVTALAEAYEYMVQYKDLLDKVNLRGQPVGWYHSHPGFGCWLSGIDVETTRTNQRLGPFIAVVIDPVRTAAAGKVDLGAFMTYPQDALPAPSQEEKHQFIPSHKISDFGAHANHYYPMNVSYFKSDIDRALFEELWKEYWMNTLSSSALSSNSQYATQQMADIGCKLDSFNDQFTSGSSGNCNGVSFRKGDGPKYLKAPHISANSVQSSKAQKSLDTVTNDGSKLAIEAAHGLMSELLKSLIFNPKHL
eukprot:CFRG6526T1